MVCRLQSASPAWRVTSPWRPVRPTAALAIQVTRGILSMGWASRSVDHVSNPTLGVHPLARSRCQGLVLEIVNLNATSSGQFGTIPIPDCPRFHIPMRPEQEGRIVLPQREHGLDLIAAV